jgi:hypothetical protein
MIMMESLFDHRRARRRSDFSHIVIEYVHRNCACRKDFRFDSSMTTGGQLTHDIRPNIFIRYLLLTIQLERQSRAGKGFWNTCSSLNRIKRLIAATRHHERCTLGLDQFFLISIWELYLMRAHNIGSETAVQDYGIPHYFVATFLAESTFGVLLSPAL